jgi:hypothetical protein
MVEGTMKPNERNLGPPTDWPDRLTDEEAQAFQDMQWAAYDPEVQERYPDKFIVVHNKQVLAAGDHLLTVLKEAEARSGLPRNHLALLWVDGPLTMLGR